MVSKRWKPSFQGNILGFQLTLYRYDDFACVRANIILSLKRGYRRFQVWSRLNEWITFDALLVLVSTLRFGCWIISDLWTVSNWRYARRGVRLLGNSRWSSTIFVFFQNFTFAFPRFASSNSSAFSASIISGISVFPVHYRVQFIIVSITWKLVLRC